jgi:hypothetical protein
MLHRAGVQPALHTLESFDASTRLTIHFATADDHAGARRWLERLAPHPITYTDAVRLCGHGSDPVRPRHRF